MKTLFAALLFIFPLAADATSIDLSAPVIVSQDGFNAQFTPVITLTPDGFTVGVQYSFNQTATFFNLELKETFTLAEPAEVALGYSASSLLYGGACTHGFCPGMQVGFNGSAQIVGIDPGVLVTASGTSSTPYLGQVQASGANSGEWLLDAGTYEVMQYAGFSAADAGISSVFYANLAFTIVDPPSAVPEPRWTGAFSVIAVLLAVCLRAARRLPGRAG